MEPFHLNLQSRPSDLNRQPSDYETDALPIAPGRHEVRNGIRTRTVCLEGRNACPLHHTDISGDSGVGPGPACPVRTSALNRVLSRPVRFFGAWNQSSHPKNRPRKSRQRGMIPHSSRWQRDVLPVTPCLHAAKEVPVFQRLYIVFVFPLFFRGVGRGGFEPPLSGFSDQGTNHLCYRPKAGSTGDDPAAFRLTAGRSAD